MNRCNHTICPHVHPGRPHPPRSSFWAFWDHPCWRAAAHAARLQPDGGGHPFSDALLTATSATCVTGLVVHDTATYWSPFGHLVLLALIQTGGMGVVTVAVSVVMFSGRKIGLRQRWVMQESISAPQVGGIVRMTSFILKAMLLIEGTGALLLSLRFCPQFGLLQGLWYGIFHSVSAFCNAGFDLMGTSAPFSSLTGYVGDPLVWGPIALLILAGGLGFLTWQDLREHRLHFRAYRLQSKLILVSTAGLLLLSFLFFQCYEFRLPQWAELSGWERLNAAAFQAVTPRTAGFNSVDLTLLSEPGKLVTILLMLVGGSPAPPPAASRSPRWQSCSSAPGPYSSAAAAPAVLGVASRTRPCAAPAPSF